MDDSFKLKNHSSEKQLLTYRIAVVTVLMLTTFGILIARYYDLQVTHHQDYMAQSDRNRILVEPISPVRGLIYDRNGVLLTDQRVSYTVSVVKEQVAGLDKTIDLLKELLPISENEIEAFHKRLRQRRRPYEATPLRFDLSEKEIARIAVNEYRLQGVEVVAHLVRHYQYGNLLAHTIGYISSINERELSRFDDDQRRLYSGTYSIGKTGLEKQYEDVLLGQVGFQKVEINAHGRRLRVLERVDPVPGKNITLNLDIELQQEASNALAGRRGAIVALDVKTGGVLASISAPTYNPNLFVTGISTQNYRQLTQSEDRPLFNRVLQGQYPPGSTMKPMLGLGALNYGVVDPTFTIRDPGYFQLEGVKHRYRDHAKYGHGKNVDLKQAIVESCNTYFYRLAFKMGIDRIHAFGSQFGLGNPTGIDLPNERRGLWPSREWKKQHLGNPWYDGDTINVGIGQGPVLLTPVQLAVMVATLANQGKRTKPQLVQKVANEPLETPIINEVTVNDKHWRFIWNAMESVVHSARGTARRISQNAKFRMAGKTGTAQAVGIAQDAKYDSEKLAERQRDHALFIGFAPAENPRIAAAVIVENGERSSDAAVVARKIFDFYLAHDELQQNTAP